MRTASDTENAKPLQSFQPYGSHAAHENFITQEGPSKDKET
jgi:hypothetical protein